MTLIELMIVVAIIGILAAIAVFVFKRATAKANASEVAAVFAEIRIRQESYHLENGQYLSIGTETSGLLPVDSPAPSSAGATLIPSLTGAFAPWGALHFNSDKNALYCSYGTQAGTPTDAVAGAVAGSFGFSGAQPVNWFYMVAFCDFDGDPGTQSTYFARSGIDGQAVLNPGN